MTIEPIGEVEPLSLDAELMTVRAGRPLPPGTRVTVRVDDEERPLAGGKVTSIANRDAETGACDVTIRLFAPERWAREKLEALVRS